MNIPEIARILGYIFYFWSNEHEPIHIHVKHGEENAKFVYNGVSFELKENNGLKKNDLRRINYILDGLVDLILAEWAKRFNNGE